ncbi:hypothetical protein BFG57_15700 [Bacillus solimangrovi]|uniref:Uncharacterized protein n=2 Tax=Bacillus solimangrovi TaxID=1305675 RepID=A0A1E5LEK8_9BACI|nr:hypothetical protein BFG57_15700 [Bacillus solimangrovi]
MEIVQVYQSDMEYRATDAVFEQNKEKSKVVKITELAQIDEILMNTSRYGYGKYVIKIKLVNGTIYFEQLDENHVPDFINKAFE